MARLDRLAPVKEVAQMGAAIGRQFSYELLAAISPLPESDLLEALRQLVDAELVFSKGRPPEAVYTFKHALVQDTAYGSLLKSRRQQLHARIAQAIETEFPKIARKEPNVLAHHFGQAGLLDKAITYHEQAGRRALASSALAEALSQFSSALEQLAMLPRSEERLNRELSIHLAMGSAHVAASGFAAPATGKAYKRSAELCEELSNTRQLFPVLYGLCLYHLYGAELAESAAAADRLMKLAQPSGDRDFVFFANRAVGVSALPAGNFGKARDHLDRALTVYDPQEHRAPAFVYAFDPRVVCLDYLARALLPLGFPEQAIATNDEAVLEARHSEHQNSLALPLFFGGVLHQMLGNQTAIEERCQELAKIAADAGFRFWFAGATILRGWTVADKGDLATGAETIEKGIEEWRATGANYMLPYFLALQAQVANKASRRDRALRLLDKAENRVERTGERWFLAEILRLKGETLAKIGTVSLAEAKASLLQASETAKAQEARYWEFRAALSLARLDPGDLSARQRLARCLAALTEGANLKDILTARSLLEKGAPAPNLKLASS
jgi:predicted ATPase